MGFDGEITGIGVTDGVGGNPLALKFTLREDLTGNPGESFNNLKVGYPIYIFDTQVGHGVTSVYSDGAVVSTGTTCVDNVYFVDAINSRTITCNIMSGVNTTGIDTVADMSVGIGISNVGAFSWGRLSRFTRLNPVSILSLIHI